MKRFRRLSLLIATIASLICIILLLNFTASNPTGRRYSSEHVVISGQSQEIGQSGELAVAKDLDQPLNNIRGEYQCLCKSNVANPPQDCAVCSTLTVPLDRQETYRVPDFVTANYIAEVKNTRDFNDPRILPQIQDYANAAAALGIPLWVYARIDTEPDQNILNIVQNTGGDIIFYLTSDGYIDPIDRLATRALLVALLLLALLLIWEWRVTVKNSPTPTNNQRSMTPMDSIETTTSFLNKAKEKTERDIDKTSTRIEIDKNGK